MILDNKMCKVIAEMEYLVGSQCYNPHSYDGWNDVEGCDYRYPINVPNQKGEYTKIRGSLNGSYLISEDSLTPETIPFII